MKLRNSARILAAAAALALGGAAPAADDHEVARALRDQGKIVALEKVIAAARQRYPGRVLEAELERSRGRYLYEVKIAGDDGNIRELKYDAETAELVADELDDD